MDTYIYKTLIVMLNAVLYAPLALGIGIAFRIARFPDLTVEGSFALGAITYYLIVGAGYGFVAAALMATLASAVAGLATGLVHYAVRVPAILAGILTWMALYSVGLRMIGRPNARLASAGLLTSLGGRDDLVPRTAHTLVLVSIVVLAAFTVVWIALESRWGVKLRCAGGNPISARGFGLRPACYVTMGLMVANAQAGLAGALFAGVNGYVDVNMGGGMLIGGVSALFLGSVALPRTTPLSLIGACLIGSLALRAVVGVSLEAGLDPGDLRLLMALVLLGSIGLSRLRARIDGRGYEESFVLQ